MNSRKPEKDITHSIDQGTLSKRDYLYLLSAILVAGVISWVILYLYSFLQLGPVFQVDPWQAPGVWRQIEIVRFVFGGG